MKSRRTVRLGQNRSIASQSSVPARTFTTCRRQYRRLHNAICPTAGAASALLACWMLIMMLSDFWRAAAVCHRGERSPDRSARRDRRDSIRWSACSSTIWAIAKC
jgi:hypothetical protein